MKIIKIVPLQKPVKTEVTIPGSKSYTNRALLLAAMFQRSIKIKDPLISDDTRAMIDCLRRLGIKILVKGNEIGVVNNINSIKNLSYDLDANESGTTIRFLLALSAIIPGVKTLYGKEGLSKRPIGDLVDGLRQLGANIKYLEREGYPPVRVSSSKLSPGLVKIKGSVSSQYTSALLMIAPLVGEVTIEVTGGQTSKSYIDMTINIMRKFGVKVQNKEENKYLILAGQKYEIREYVVEGDISSAAYFFAIAALNKSTITIKNINPESVQADMKFLKILGNMGSKVISGKNQVTIIGKGVKPVDVDMKDCPDQVQTLAVLASFAFGITKISGIESLRIKETDRIAALEQELGKMGIKTSYTHDALVIHGGNPKAARIETHGDHRMAMSFAVAGTKLSGMRINDPDVVNKTFPDFWKKLNSIGIKTKPIKVQNIILIGMRGSGKTTVARLLSQKLNRECLELDEIIVKKTGMKIPEIVEKKGWNYFRDEESEVVKEVSLQNGKVISTGGGVITRPGNIDTLKKNGILIFLNVSLKTLVKRMGKDLNRPLLTNAKNRQEELENLLQEREKLYIDAADRIIYADNLDSNEVVNTIVLNIKENI